MFKFNIGEAPKPISNKFMVNCFFHNHNTRSIGYLHTPLGRSEASYRTASFIGGHIWNDMFVTKYMNQCFLNVDGAIHYIYSHKYSLV